MWFSATFISDFLHPKYQLGVLKLGSKRLVDVIAQFEICGDVPTRMVGAGNEQLASFSAGNSLLKNTKDLLLIFVI